MPLRVINEGFFGADGAPAPDNPAVGAFVACAQAAALQATWARLAWVDQAGEASDEPGVAVVYLGDPASALDNDAMAALRSALPEAFPGDDVLVVSSPSEGRVDLHAAKSGDDLLRAAAVASVVQAATLWDKTNPMHVWQAHRHVVCTPSFDPANQTWSASAELG